jgi:DNA-binding CsgD family transcriptional regulator
MFLIPPSILCTIAMIVMSFLAGCCVAGWGYFFRHSTPTDERIKTAADGLIFSNLLMIVLNAVAILISPVIGLGLSLVLLAAALLVALQLPTRERVGSIPHQHESNYGVGLAKPLGMLCLFIVIITINAGLMYQVVNPAFVQLDWLVSWYWALPYIVALFVMRQLPRTTNRAYILYVAIAMIGFSFIAFLVLDRSAASYILIDTLLLGACGIYDLFWWSILGKMLDYDANPAKVLGIGLSANVFGVLLGVVIGNAITETEARNVNTTLLALGVVLIILVILPILHKQLTAVLQDHEFLTAVSDMSVAEQTKAVHEIVSIGQLTERESEIVDLLLRGRTYKMIADELYLSENTVKTHIKNIYSKLSIKSRTELIHLMQDRERSVLV